MKKLFLLPILALLPALSQAQSTVTFKPGPAVGQDALLYTHYGCTTDGNSAPAETQNHGTSPELWASDWTYNAIGCPHGTIRTLIRFSELANLPPTATIINAQLRLFGVPSSTSFGNSSYPGAPFGTTNEGWVRRVTSPWAENTVTWNSQPATTTANQALLPVTNAHWNWNASVDVTAMVNDMRASCQNEGFELILQNENFYRAQLYASSDHANPELWPELQITYCDPGFTFCSSAICPNQYTFHPNDTQAPYIEWSVNGNVVYTGPSAPLTYNFPGPGSYKVCLVVKGEKEGCEHCMQICVAEYEKPCIPCKEGPVKTEKAEYRSSNVPNNGPQGKAISGDRDFLRVGDISPNPTRAGWSLTVLSTTAVKGEVVVYDITGNAVLRQAAALDAGANTIALGARKLPAGTYIVHVNANGTKAQPQTVVKY